MAKVKGSKQYQVKVVTHHPQDYWIRRAGFVLGCLLCITAAFYYGKRHSSRDIDVLILQERDKLANEIANLKSENEKLQQDIANLTVNSKVTEQSMESLRKEITGLQEQAQVLEEQNRRYREVVESGKGRKVHSAR